MTLTFTDGTLTATSTEKSIFNDTAISGDPTVGSITADNHFATHIFSHNMASGDTFVIKIYVKDQNGNAMRLYDPITLTNAQTSPDGWIPYLPTKQYNVTITRTAGTDRVFTWKRVQSDVPMTFTDGSITTTTSEDTIFDTTANHHFGAFVFTHNMQAGDTMVFRLYMKDQNAAVMRLFDVATLTDAQTSPAYFIPFISTKEYKLTVQKTAGSNRAITWQRIESA